MLENHSLKALNSLALDARARFFTVATDMVMLADALAFARQRELQVLLLGGGSNVVLTEDFPGLCIQLASKGISAQQISEGFVRVTASGGENWHDFVGHCLNNGWYGLENLALIPGTVGAAPVQNIGAYGVEIKDFMHSLQALDRHTLKTREFLSDECCFGYRDSVFKGSMKDRYVITAVTFELSLNAQLNCSYSAIGQLLRAYDNPGPKQLFDAVVAVRSEKLPNPALLPNAGSFFKNPVVSAEQYDRLKLRYPNLVAYPDDGGFKLAAGWLIDQAGWKGYRDGDVGVHRHQALVLVNYGTADGRQLLDLAARIRADILTRFGVGLEIEPRCY